MKPAQLCDECGGVMVLSIGPGRYRAYRGEPGYVIPADLAYPVCPQCGAEWLTSEQIDDLSDALEVQRARRRIDGGLTLVTYPDEYVAVADYPVDLSATEVADLNVPVRQARAGEGHAGCVVKSGEHSHATSLDVLSTHTDSVACG